jgi:hypothetical protein
MASLIAKIRKWLRLGEKPDATKARYRRAVRRSGAMSMSEPRTIELTEEQISFLGASLDYSAMHSRDYDYGPELVDFGKHQRASEEAMIASIRGALADAQTHVG